MGKTKLIERFETCFTQEDKEQYFDSVKRILTSSYSAIGGLKSIRDYTDLLNDRYLWKLVRRGDRITACAIYKTEDGGRKISALGTDGSEQGKKDLYMILDEDLRFSNRGMWAEVSGSVEHIINKKINLMDSDNKFGLRIPAEEAVRILRKDGKKAEVVTSQWLKDNKGNPKVDWDEIDLSSSKGTDFTDGYHYAREIGKNPKDIKIHIKSMVGRLPDELKEGFDTKLNEDKVVKFGGEVSPKFGWCTILVGGPGSGKSFSLKNFIPIDSKIYNPDDVKQLYLSHKQDSELDGGTYLEVPTVDNNGKITGKEKIDLDNATIDMGKGEEPIGKPYDLSNPKYLSFIHKKLKPLNNLLKDNILHLGANANKDRLPNITFDICGSDIKDLDEIIQAVKPLGYKICLIWLIASPDVALDRNNKRDRKGDELLVLNKHRSVYQTMGDLLANNALFQAIDDFWVILTDLKGKSKAERLNNCFEIKNKDGLIDFTNKYLTNDKFQKKQLTQTQLADLIKTNDEKAAKLIKQKI